MGGCLSGDKGIMPRIVPAVCFRCTRLLSSCPGWKRLVKAWKRWPLSSKHIQVVLLALPPFARETEAESCVRYRPFPRARREFGTSIAPCRVGRLGMPFNRGECNGHFTRRSLIFRFESIGEEKWTAGQGHKSRTCPL